MAINKNKINDNALKFIQKGQVKKAIREYEKILNEDPNDVRTLLKKGDLLVRVGDKGQAVDTYLKVATTYSQQGFHLKAVAVFKQILKIDDTRIDVNLRLAEEYQNLGIAGDAMTHLQVVASHYDQQGMTRESLDILRRIVELDPENVASRIKLAELYSREGMVTEAVEEFAHAAEDLKGSNRIEDYIKVAERLIFHDNSNLALVKELANIYLQRGDTKRALGKLQICFKSDPRDLETLGMLALAFQELNQLSKTVSVYKEMAKIYQEQESAAEVQQIYRRILEIVPDDLEANQALSGLAHGPAQPAYQDATVQQRPPSGLQVPADVAAVQETDVIVTEPRPQPAPKQPAPALQEVTAPQPEPTPEQAREMVSRLLTETDVYIKYGLQSKALEHLSRIFKMDPNNIEAHEKLKDLYVSAGQMNHAARELLVLAQLTYRVGQAEEARAYLRSLLTISPDHPEGMALAEQLGATAPVAHDMPVEEEDLQLTDPAGPEVMVLDEDATVEVGSLDDFEVPQAGLDEAIELVEDDEQSEPSFDIEEDVPIDVEEDALLDDDIQAGEEVPDLDVGEDEILEPPQDDGAETVIAMSPMDIESLDLESGDKSEFEEERQATVAYPKGSAEAYLDQDDVGAPEVIELLDDEGTPARPMVPPGIAEQVAGEAEPELIEFGEDEEFFEEIPEPFEPAPELPKSPPPTIVDEAPGEEFAEEFRGEELGPDDLEPIEDVEETHKPTTVRPASREELEMAGLGAEELSSEAMSAIDEAVEGEVDEVFVEDVVEPQDQEPAVEVAVEDVSDDGLAVEEIEDDQILIDDEPVITEPIQVPDALPQEAEALDDTEPEVAEPLPEEPEEEDELADALEEIDFYIQQNLLEEAAEELEQLKETYPDNAEILERLEKIERMQQGEAPIAQLSPDDLEGPFDLASEIEREVGEDAAPVPLDEDFQYSFDDVFSEFKKGVERVVAKEDSSTHFDLGIAYKEMGLFEDAISEFNIAAQDGAKRTSALTMIGLCNVEKGQYSEAINRFKEALHGPGISDQEATGVYYEMGCAYELLSDVEEALFYYKKVQKRNSNFRDVAARIKALAKAGVQPKKDEGEKKNQKNSSGSKNKISYM